MYPFLFPFLFRSTSLPPSSSFPLAFSYFFLPLPFYLSVYSSLFPPFLSYQFFFSFSRPFFQAFLFRSILHHIPFPISCSLLSCLSSSIYTLSSHSIIFFPTPFPLRFSFLLYIPIAFPFHIPLVLYFLLLLPHSLLISFPSFPLLFRSVVHTSFPFPFLPLPFTRSFIFFTSFPLSLPSPFSYFLSFPSLPFSSSFFYTFSFHPLHFFPSISPFPLFHISFHSRSFPLLPPPISFFSGRSRHT